MATDKRVAALKRKLKARCAAARAAGLKPVELARVLQGIELSRKTVQRLVRKSRRSIYLDGSRLGGQIDALVMLNDLARAVKAGEVRLRK